MSFRRTLLVWLLILPLMVGNGVLRETLLVGWLGRRGADLASATLGVVIILSVTRPFLRRAADRSRRSLAVVSATWLILTVAFEFLFGHYVDGKPWPALAANYQVWNGALWPFVLIALVGAPFLWARPLDPPNHSPVPRHG